MQFADKLKIMYRFYKEEFHEDAAMVWSIRLKREGIPLDEASIALDALMGNRFMPKPEDVIAAIRGTSQEQKAEQAYKAWGLFWAALHKVGYNNIPTFEDPKISRVIDRLYGGWHEACLSENLHTGIAKQQFCECYNSIKDPAPVVLKSIMPDAKVYLVTQSGKQLSTMVQGKIEARHTEIIRRIAGKETA